jgi:Domain of unknown function (DUF1924)
MNIRMLHYPKILLCALAGSLYMATLPALARGPQEMLAAYVSESGQAADAERGKAFFNARHGQALTCTACHGDNPALPGKHASTGKVIAPLAPGANGERFTDVARSEKWFRRNCKEVVGRECSPSEKADVLAWLMKSGLTGQSGRP